MTPQETAKQLVILLRPLKREGDTWDPDELIREAVRLALKELDVYGAGGCLLCMQ